MHRHVTNMVVLLLAIVITLGLTACSDEPREMTIHEPGKYKGSTDPLLAKGQHPELNHRFIKVQTDR